MFKFSLNYCFLVKWVSSGSWKFYIFCSVLKSSKVWKFLEKSFLCLCIIHCIVLLMAAGKSSDQVITTSVQSIMGSSSTPSGLALTHSIYPLPPAPNTWDHQIHLHFPIFSRILLKIIILLIRCNKLVAQWILCNLCLVHYCSCLIYRLQVLPITK